MTRSAEMTGRTTTVLATQHRRGLRHDSDVGKLLLQNTADMFLEAVHRDRRQIFSVRSRGILDLRLSADSREVLDVVIPLLDVRVANRPVRGQSVARIFREVDFAPPGHYATPGQRAPAE